MKHKKRDYINHIVVDHGTCINTGEFGEAHWKGYSFSIRDNLDDYENIKDWYEDYGHTIQYCYRDFNETGSSPDMIRSEFSLWYGDYSGSEFMDIMTKLEKVIYLYSINNKIFTKQPLTKLEIIAKYIETNAYNLINKKLNINQI